MESLPLETLQRIFELACTDGGLTGNALSATSRQIRAAARRSRFHTLQLAAYSDGFPDFVAFCGRSWNVGDSDKPRVRHLYLKLSSSTWTPITQIQPSLHAQTTSFNKPPPSLSCWITVQDLLQLVAPDLYSLAIHIGPFGLRWDLEFPILEHTFPLVREATFFGLPSPARLMGPDAKLSTAFPAATHLHLTPDLNNHDLHLASWATLAPRVTHLRVSSIRNKAHVEQIAEAVGVHVRVSIFVMPEPEPAPPLPPRTYPSVRFLLMEPGVKPKGGRCGNPLMAHGAMTFGLRKVVSACRTNVGVQASVMPEPGDVLFPQQDEQVWREWVERVEGGDGWWKWSEST